MNPLFRLTVAFALGILTQSYWPISNQLILALGVSTVIGWITCFFYLKNRYGLGSFTFISFILLGIVNVMISDALRSPNHLSHAPIESTTAYRAHVSTFPETIAKTHRAVVEVSHIYVNGQWKSVNGKVQLYINKAAPRPQFGAELIILGAPKPIEPPLNPEQFDFRQFQAYKQIYFQHYLQPSQYVLTGKLLSHWWVKWPYQIGQWSDTRLKQLVPINREYAVAKAMILGLRNDMDHELVQAYSAAGAIHVLSVSGFHMGVFVAILAFLLQQLKTSPKGRWLYAGLTLTILWFYAILTGLSAPVVRSAIMFSLFLLADPLHRKANGENALFGSAFLLLAYDPFLLFSVSFQLSYTALGGIIFGYPLVYQWFSFNDWLVDKIWAITAVALTAQLATFPLTVYYFHQFPTYFLLANPLVVALSTAMIPIALLAISLSPLPYFGTLCGWVLTGIVWLLNQSIVWIEKIPYSTLNSLSFSKIEVGIVYAIIGTLLLFWYQKNSFWLRICFSLSLLLALSQSNSLYKNRTQKTLVVHNVPKQMVISIIEGQHATVVADADFFSSTSQGFSFYMKNFYDIQGVRQLTKHSLHSPSTYPLIRTFSFGKLLVWNGYKLLLLEKPLNRMPVGFVDHILIRKNAVRNLTSIQNRDTSPFLFDSSISPYYLNPLIQQTQQNRFPWYFTAQKGAKIIHL